MNKIRMLAFYHIKKSRGHSISLLIMLVIASALLNIGLLLSNHYNSYFETIINQLDTSDCYITLPMTYYNGQVWDFLLNHSNVEEAQQEPFIPQKVNVKNSEKDDTLKTMILFNNEENRSLSKKKFIGGYLPLDNDSIYVPYYFYVKWGYRLNDTLELDLEGMKKEYAIKGFTEDIYFSTPDTGGISGYLTSQEFNRIREAAPNLGMVFFANLKEDTAKVEMDLDEFIVNNVGPDLEHSNSFFTSSVVVHRSVCQSNRTMMANLIAVMLVALSFIVMAVCLIVIRFRIRNSIEEDMVQIGSLKAIGYTSTQIIASIVIQFGIIGFAGGLLGLGLSYPALPVLSHVLAYQSGLKWEQGFDLPNSLGAFAMILIFVCFLAFLSAHNIKRLNPIFALRGGISSHSFRKNHLPLDRSKGALAFLLGAKAILHNKKQSFMIGLISVAITFSGIFGLVMFYNSFVNTTTFAETPGVERSNLEVLIDPKATDPDRFANEIKRRDGVEHAQYVNNMIVNAEGIHLLVMVMENFDDRRTKTVYEGRYPIHHNEIALNGNAARLLDKKIGDMVMVKGQDGDIPYLITGFQQGMTNSAMNCAMTFQGYRKLYPEFLFDNLCIYLKNGMDAEQYLEILLQDYDGILLKTWNVDKEFEAGMGSYISIVSKVGIAVLLVSICIVILVLYFVIHSLILRCRRELGIQKALGFTTFQLMNQITLSILPLLAMGVFLGSLLGAYAINPIMSFVQQGMGIMKANYIILPSWIVLYGIAVMVVSYFTAMAITFKIRKISAYTLVTE